MRRAVLIALTLLVVPEAPGQAITVASKKFTENVILGEVVAQRARAVGVEATHRRELGGTRILWNALLAGEIQAYPDYSGTILQEILSGAFPTLEAAGDTLAALGLAVSAPLGFNNTYVLGMRSARAEALDIRTITDLTSHPDLTLAFSNEFMDREDGWPALRAHYALPHADVRGLDHDLAYRGLSSGDIDVMDLYSTDAEIQAYDITPLQDDLRLFPDYHAVVVYRVDAGPHLEMALSLIEGAIPEDAMIAMNARARLEREAESRVASDFLATLGQATTTAGAEKTRIQRLTQTTREHLILVGISLLAAILVAIPLGILAARGGPLEPIILGVVGVIYTIPGLALLVFMIPLLGIGGPPAMVALFLYSLLPIVRGTHAGLASIPAPLKESASVLALGHPTTLWRIELPLASRSILSGIKTAAVINVGTATLGALIGAGGYGQPILTGIRLDDTELILEGAVPAAVLALVVQGIFDIAERRLTPRGLRHSPE